MKKIVLLAGLILLATDAFSQSLDTLLEPLTYRNVGPFRGGRSVTATGVVGDPLTYYMGNTGGGLWKTTDAGQYWNNISDGFMATASVGAIAASESDPNTLYCGMGEHAPRGVMTTYGDGVYKSTDAGKTWVHMGLEKTQHISRIVIHPTNPDIVFVAAQGALNGPTPERGIYKSTDGGKTWSNKLFVNNLTGCAELSMDMHNPQVMYAAMWEHQRLPWQVISGGAGSGLYKTTDGGESWNKIHNGLPKEMGKMAIAVSRANSNKVYALIESDTYKEKGGLFVSENAGDSWTKVSGDHRLVQRAWYYIEVFPDPNDEHTVYVMSAPALRSIDGGKTWEVLSGTHGDYHDLWINPDNSNNMVIANDGGAAISFNTGKTWSTQDNMATVQFYRVSVDNEFPYNIYGGQQDNSSVKINSIALNRSGIDEQNWTYSAGGESAFLAYDPDDPRYVMGGSYLGDITLLDTEAVATTKVMATPVLYLGRDAKDQKYRFNWNAPIIWSAHEPGTFYHGAQGLLRSRDMGISWEEVSPDLTRNEISKQGTPGVPYTNEAVGAENYGTLSYVLESPQEKGTIWTGSDDGLVHLTRNGGASWENVTPKGLAECLINAIEVSPHDPTTAYIATTRYKFNDHTPALYKTTDHGKSWTNITSGIPHGAYTRVVSEDPVRKDLLFAGTEAGMYVSWNGGKKWERMQLNLPVVAITDLKLKHNDLIIATAGRSFWILDDMELLRQYKKGNEVLTVYRPDDAVLGNWRSELSSNKKKLKGSHPLRGVNPANGVVIYYDLPELTEDTVLQMEISDANGQLVRAYTSEPDMDYQKYDGGPSKEAVLTTNRGLNRLYWDMRHPIMPGVSLAYIEGSYNGHKASPGAYTITLKTSTASSSTEVNILHNPHYGLTDAQYAEYHNMMLGMEQELTQMHHGVNNLYDMGQQLADLLGELTAEDQISLREAGMQLAEKIKAWDGDMVQRLSKAYDDVENYPNKFTANYLYLINQTQSDIPRVTQGSVERLKELTQQWEVLKARGEEIMNTDVAAYNKKLWEAGIGAIKVSATH